MIERYNQVFYENFHNKTPTYQKTPPPAVIYEFNCIALNLLKNTTNCKLIDIGCGDGTILKLIIDQFPSLECIGVDISKNAVYKAKDINPDLDFIIADVTHLPFKYEIFEYVVSNNNIEHIPDDEAAFCEMARITKFTGMIYLGTPNANYLPIFKNYRNKIDKIAGHLRAYSKIEAENKLQEVGFKLKKVEYHYHILYIYCYRYLLYLMNCIFKVYCNIINFKGSVYDCGDYPHKFMQIILTSVLKIEKCITRKRCTSHYDFFIVATKILK